jgi:hypothetical protein
VRDERAPASSNLPCLYTRQLESKPEATEARRKRMSHSHVAVPYPFPPTPRLPGTASSTMKLVS